MIDASTRFSFFLFLEIQPLERREKSREEMKNRSFSKQHATNARRRGAASAFKDRERIEKKRASGGSTLTQEEEEEEVVEEEEEEEEEEEKAAQRVPTAYARY